MPFLARPFFIYALRDAYLKVGASHHRQMHMQMAKLLEEKLRAEGMPDARVYVSFLDDNPRPDAALIQALNDGASRIIVAEVFLTISNHTKEGEAQIEATRLVAETSAPSAAPRATSTPVGELSLL